MGMQLGGGYRSVANSLDKATATADLISRMSSTKVSLMELFKLHIIARNGELTLDKDDADIVISEDGDINPFDIAQIASEFM
jgi:hypothetical protein